MTNSTDVSDVKMTRFGYRVDIIVDQRKTCQSQR